MKKKLVCKFESMTAPIVELINKVSVKWMNTVMQLANGTVIHQHKIESIIAYGISGVIYKVSYAHLNELS